MENPEEILHSLEEFSKLKPRDIPRELEEYLCFVAKTGDPVYQWSTVKSLFKEKLQNVVADFYESCPSIDIPPCPNVDVFNYESMKVFILEKLDTFVAAPFTVQRICELLTTPRKEYNRIDKYMRALEKNILVVSTTEPGNRHNNENGDGIMNGVESEHNLDTNNSNDINVEETDDAPVWSRIAPDIINYQHVDTNVNVAIQCAQDCDTSQPNFDPEPPHQAECGSSIESVITCRPTQEPYVSIEPVLSEGCIREEISKQSDVTVTITAIPASIPKRQSNNIEPIVSSEEEISPDTSEAVDVAALEVDAEFIPKPLAKEEESSEDKEPCLTTNETLDDLNEKFEECESAFDAPEVVESSLCDTIEPVESSSDKDLPIQTPIISDIVVDFISSENDKKCSLLVPDCESGSVVESDVIMKDETETKSEQLPEVSTTVSSTVESELVESKEYESVLPLSEEALVTPVSSTADCSILPSTDSSEVCKSEEDVPSLSLSTDDISVDKEEVECKPSVDLVLDSIQEFAPSSTSQLAMDVDIGDERCEELPVAAD